MKSYIPYSLLAAAACGLAYGETAYTTPVGYNTTSLEPNKYNLVSVTLHNSPIYSGIISAESSETITSTGANFSSLLQAGVSYVLELPNGTIQEITSWNGDSLTTPDDITASVVPGTTTFILRKATTVADLLGASNAVGLTPDSDDDYTSGNDLVLIPNASGAFDTVYYYDNGSDPGGWFDDLGNSADSKPLIYADSLFIQRGDGSAVPLVVTGEIKKAPTAGVLTPGFNFVGAVSPVGLTVSSSGLDSFLTGGDSEESADNILLQNSNGTYRTIYLFNDGESPVAWFDTLGEPADEVSLDGGFLIFNRGATKPAVISVPSSYNGL